MNGEKIRVGNILSHSIWFSWRFFPSFIIPAILLELLVIAVAWLSVTSGNVELEPQFSSAWVVAAIPAMIVGIIVYGLMQAVITVGVVRNLQETPVTLSEAIRVSLSALGRVILASLLVSVLAGLGFMLIIPGIFLMICWIAVIPVTVVEGRSAVESLSRSWMLTDGNRWRIFGLFAATIALMFVYGGAVGLVELAIGSPEGGWLRVVADLLYLPASLFSWVVIAVTYYHLRLAKDGVDIKELAGVFD